MGRLLDEDTVIKVLECWQKAFRENSHYVSASDLSLVVKDVRELPPAQPVATDTNVGDTISRQALCEYALNQKDKSVTPNDIMRFPSAQPEPKEGHWIRTDCGLDVECKCSRCGYRDFVEPRDEYWFKRNYCPNCGAKMKGETKEDEQ